MALAFVEARVTAFTHRQVLKLGSVAPGSASIKLEAPYGTHPTAYRKGNTLPRQRAAQNEALAGQDKVSTLNVGSAGRYVPVGFACMCALCLTN